MIITTDLRAAIRSAEKKQPNRHGTNWELREKQKAEAFAKLTQSKKHKRVYAQAMVLRKESDRLAQKAGGVFTSIGLSFDGSKIYDDVKFVAAGGVLPPTEKKPWTYDTVMAELAAADPKQGKAILKKYGINWS